MKTTSGLGFILKPFHAILLFIWLPNLLSAQLNLTVTPTPITCYGAGDGKAEASPIGGTAPYTYHWNNDATSKIILNLLPGMYSVTVTDVNQNTATAATTITQPTLLGLTIAGQSQLCDVAPDGWTLAVPYSGTAPYTYLWSNGPTTAQNNNLAGGTYTATVTDAHGCTISGAYVVSYWADGLWMNFETTDALCGLATGSATIDYITGTPPYQFHWSTGDTTQFIANRAAGTYTLLVSDVNGCATHSPLNVVIEEDSPAPVDSFLQQPLCLNQLGSFAAAVLPSFTQFYWTLNNPSDQIIQGQSTNSILAQWNSTGTKTATMQYGTPNNLCGIVTFHLTVDICADAHEAPLDAVNVSPNPFSNFLKIDLPAGFPAKYGMVLTDVSGKITLRQRLSGNAVTIATDNIPRGIYCLKIKSESDEKVWKLAKQ